MKKPVFVGLFFAFCFIIVKMLTYFLGMFADTMKPMGLLNMLFLLSAISVGLYQHMKYRDVKNEDFMKEIKQAMRAGFIYTVIVSGFIFVYYKSINPEFFQKIKTEQIESLRQGVEDPKLLAKMRSENSALQLMEPEEIIQQRQKQVDQFMSPNFTFIITLMGMTLLSVLYSVFVTLVYRKVLFRV